MVVQGRMQGTFEFAFEAQGVQRGECDFGAGIQEVERRVG